MAEDGNDNFADFMKYLKYIGYVPRANINEQLVIPIGVNNVIRPRERDFLAINEPFRHRYYILSSEFRPDLYPFDVNVTKPCFECGTFAHLARQCPTWGNNRTNYYDENYLIGSEIFQFKEELQCAYDKVDFVECHLDLAKMEIDRLLHVISNNQIQDQQELNFAGQISNFYQDQNFELRQELLLKCKTVKPIQCRVADDTYLLKQQREENERLEKSNSNLCTQKLKLWQLNKDLSEKLKKVTIDDIYVHYNDMCADFNEVKDNLFKCEGQLIKTKEENSMLTQLVEEFQTDDEKKQICKLGKCNNALRRDNEAMSKEISGLKVELLKITNENDTRKTCMDSWSNFEDSISLMDFEDVNNFFQEYIRLKGVEQHFTDFMNAGLFKLKATEVEPCSMGNQSDSEDKILDGIVDEIEESDATLTVDLDCDTSSDVLHDMVENSRLGDVNNSEIVSDNAVSISLNDNINKTLACDTINDNDMLSSDVESIYGDEWFDCP